MTGRPSFHTPSPGPALNLGRIAAAHRAWRRLVAGRSRDREGVAFLGMAYMDHAALDHPPTLAKLDSLIVDRDPLLELWESGPRSGYTVLVGELSSLARTNGFVSRCKRLK